MLLGHGGTTGEMCKQLGVSEQTYYRWRKLYGGMKVDQAKRLKALEVESARLRRAVAELTVDKQRLKEVAAGKVLSPARRRGGICRSHAAMSQR